MSASVSACVVRRKASLRWRLCSSRATWLSLPCPFRLRAAVAEDLATCADIHTSTGGMCITSNGEAFTVLDGGNVHAKSSCLTTVGDGGDRPTRSEGRHQSLNTLVYTAATTIRVEKLTSHETESSWKAPLSSEN